MIVLAILLALVFAWACIATSVAVAKDQLNAGNRGIIARQQLEITELRDRFQASSLSEHYAARQIAMQPGDQGVQQEYDYDATGLVRSPRAPRDPDDE